MTTSKIKIKLGAIEVEYEGSESFLKEELPALLSAVSDLYQKSQAQDITKRPDLTGAQGGGKKQKIEATTGSIAAKLQVKSGPDLIMAAAARMNFVEGVGSFSRQRLIDEMKTATAYFKATYVNNLSKYLQGLVKEGKLNEPSQGNYAMTASSIENLGARIV